MMVKLIYLLAKNVCDPNMKNSIAGVRLSLY